MNDAVTPSTPLSASVASAASSAEIKLLVLDIDGTIAGISNTIREPVKQAIQAVQQRGVQVAIATGRMYRSALRFHQEVGSTLPLISYQGALIQDPSTQKVHRHWTVSHKTALQLLDHFEQSELRSLLSVHFYLNDRLYVREITPITESYAERSGVEPIPVGDLRHVLLAEPAKTLLAEPAKTLQTGPAKTLQAEPAETLQAEPTKILALSDDPTLIDRLFHTLRTHYKPAELYLTKSVATFFEATNPLVNKGTAVRYLAEDILGLTAAQVMTIGDNFNDVEMLAYAGVGVAMGEAPDEVKASANWVAPSVELDGVVAAIEQFVL